MYTILHLPNGVSKDDYIRKRREDVKKINKPRYTQLTEDSIKQIQDDTLTKICDGSCGQKHSYSRGVEETTLFLP
jgi:hypothetical protein